MQKQGGEPLLGNTRKSMHQGHTHRGPTTMHHPKSHGMGHSQSLQDRFSDSTPKEATSPPVIPTRLRHTEVALATILWLGFLPAAFFFDSPAVNCTMLAGIIGLMLHAWLTRPYFTEFEEEEEEEMMDMLNVPRPTVQAQEDTAKKDYHNKDVLEEGRLVYLLVVLASIVACCISFASGGSLVVHTWLAPTAADCSVANLAKLELEHARFQCSDGFVDLARRMTLAVFNSTWMESYADFYHIAPVYTTQPSGPGTARPIAWSVSKNYDLASDPCKGKGLCGLFASKYGFSSDNQHFMSMLNYSGDNAFNITGEEEQLPMVSLTNLADPEGKLVFLSIAGVAYVFALAGLLYAQCMMYAEKTSKLDVYGSRLCCGNAATASGYTPLTHDQDDDVGLSSTGFASGGAVPSEGSRSQ